MVRLFGAAIHFISVISSLFCLNVIYVIIYSFCFANAVVGHGGLWLGMLYCSPAIVLFSFHAWRFPLLSIFGVMWMLYARRCSRALTLHQVQGKLHSVYFRSHKNSLLLLLQCTGARKCLHFFMTCTKANISQRIKTPQQQRRKRKKKKWIVGKEKSFSFFHFFVVVGMFIFVCVLRPTSQTRSIFSLSPSSIVCLSEAGVSVLVFALA